MKARIKTAINENQDQTKCIYQTHTVKTTPVSPFTERTAPHCSMEVCWRGWAIAVI